MGEARDFKFGVRIDRQAYKSENIKVGQKGRGLRHMSYLYNFCTPTSVERLNLQTSNLMHRLTTRVLLKSLQTVNDLQGHSRSLSLLPFDRPYTISY